MDEENKDVNVEESTEVESETASEESSTTETNSEKTVPYERFQEVNSKMRDLEQQIQSLTNRKEDKGLSPEQEKELQAKQFLKNLMKETLDEESKSRAEAEKKELDAFNNEVSDILSIHTDVKKADFLKFLEEKADEYGVKSVSGAMKLYKDISNLSKEVSDKTKKDLNRKPAFPSSEGASSEKETNDSGKSLRQIASEITRGIK